MKGSNPPPPHNAKKPNPPPPPPGAGGQHIAAELHEGLSNIDIYARWTQSSSFYVYHDEKSTAELVYLVAGIVGEAGEFADAFKKLYRRDGMKGWEEASPEERIKLFDELGDLLWYIARTLIFFGVRFDGLCIHNMVKLRNRLIERNNYTEETVPWPAGLPYDAALKLTQLIESRITARNASPSTDTDTSSKQP